MESSRPRQVKKSRKRHMCTWCWERIEAGSSYWTWFTYGENCTARMHEECFEAQRRADRYDEELPPPGTYPRGCWCGEKRKDCKCAETLAKEKE
jgi:hypothetical protein